MVRKFFIFVVCFLSGFYFNQQAYGQWPPDGSPESPPEWQLAIPIIVELSAQNEVVAVLGTGSFISSDGFLLASWSALADHEMRDLRTGYVFAALERSSGKLQTLVYGGADLILPAPEIDTVLIKLNLGDQYTVRYLEPTRAPPMLDDAFVHGLAPLPRYVPGRLPVPVAIDRLSIPTRHAHHERPADLVALQAANPFPIIDQPIYGYIGNSQRGSLPDPEAMPLIIDEQLASIFSAMMLAPDHLQAELFFGPSAHDLEGVFGLGIPGHESDTGYHLGAEGMLTFYLRRLGFLTASAMMALRGNLELRVLATALGEIQQLYASVPEQYRASFLVPFERNAEDISQAIADFRSSGDELDVERLDRLLEANQVERSSGVVERIDILDGATPESRTALQSGSIEELVSAIISQLTNVRDGRVAKYRAYDVPIIVELPTAYENQIDLIVSGATTLGVHVGFQVAGNATVFGNRRFRTNHGLTIRNMDLDTELALRILFAFEKDLSRQVGEVETVQHLRQILVSGLFTPEGRLLIANLSPSSFVGSPSYQALMVELSPGLGGELAAQAAGRSAQRDAQRRLIETHVRSGTFRPSQTVRLRRQQVFDAIEHVESVVGSRTVVSQVDVVRRAAARLPH